MGCHQPTKDYVARTAEGKTKTEVMRFLKRHRPRSLPNLLTAAPAAARD
jgi:transposase